MITHIVLSAQCHGRQASNFIISTLLCLMLIAATGAEAGNFTMSVQDADGNPVSGFRWLLQEDPTFHPVPGDTSATDILSFGFHKSYHPLATKRGGANPGESLSGNTDGSSVAVFNVPGNANSINHYYLSVLPYEGYALSGASVLINKTGPESSGNVTVTVQKHPIPTAQITFYLFHDNFPVNGAPDLPEEQNPDNPANPNHVDFSGWSLFLEEPAGKYGQNGGQVIADAFGNPLGTSYVKSCDANGNTDADPQTNYGCFDPTTGEAVVDVLGDGTIHPDASGLLTVKNLVPAKYGTILIPPPNSGWVQTTTMEGSHVIDAWVKANEPPFFTEFGPPGPHVFVGFIKTSADGGFPPLPAPLPGNDVATVSGTITNNHMSRAPDFTFHSGSAFPDCYIALNDTAQGIIGRGVYAAPCNGDSSFSIDNVPPGNYQLQVWDANLDIVFASMPFSVDQNGGSCNGGLNESCSFGDIPVFNWFGRLGTTVFNDVNQNGFKDDGEIGIGPESQAVNIRWRDGTVYQSFPTDNGGEAPFDEVFPFFHWLVAEVDFVNKKATGATFIVDAGGLPDPNFDLELNPQPQCIDDGTGATVGYDPTTNACPPGTAATNPNTQDNLSRTETGPVLTQAIQLFLGQKSILEFGKTDYVTFTAPSVGPEGFIPPTFVGENGGISGLVFYAITRAEDDPRFAAAETWEPGIPRVQVNLYADGDIDSFPLGDFPNGVGDIDWNGNGALDPDDNAIDDVDGDGLVTLADVDNYPLENFPGNEDLDHNGNGIFDYGDAINVTYTDSWDDSLPTGCQGQTYVTPQGTSTDCFDGLRNFNQVRPGVFDGGYAFAGYDMDRLNTINPALAASIQAYYDHINGLGLPYADMLQLGILPGDYIVGSNAPPGYEHIKEEDRNVDFGEEFIPSAQALAVSCVGADHQVPELFSMLTKDGSGSSLQALPGVDVSDPGNAAPFAGDIRTLCDLKKVPLSSGQNAAADFFLMTDVPIAANVVGGILNDLANEFNPNAPAFGEKFAPPFLPVAFYDWQGNVVSRIHADQFGKYNAVVPSTWTVNVGMPSGVSPNMLTACMNDAGPIPNEAYDPVTNPEVPQTTIDPWFDPQYSQFCYVFQYMPGSTTYLDTPVLPIAAFAGPGQFPVDCELPTLTPMIASVNRRNNTGASGPFALPGQPISINSMGLVTVVNPEWDGSSADKMISRDYGFDINATARLEAEDGTSTPLTISSQNGQRIYAQVPATVAPGDYQVVVVNVGGTESPIGVTLTVGTTFNGAEVGVRPNGINADGSLKPLNANRVYAVHSVSNGESIQDAIDFAAAGDLILVAPGAYDEIVIMYKPVKLQGWGAGEVTINARQAPSEKIVAWREKIAQLDSVDFDRLPGQENLPGTFPALAEAILPTEEGTGVLVLGKRSGLDRFTRLANRKARIDGFTIIGASTGGGIVANGYNQWLRVSNNRVTANAGAFGGGIRIGHPQLSHEILDEQDPAFVDGQTEVGDLAYDDAFNDNIRLHHNMIFKNGGFGGAGGGISMHTGADAYKIQSNRICGNFSVGGGGGIGHLGRSNGLIEDNTIIFNESFSQTPGSTPPGGGILIRGQAGLMPESETGLLLTPGAGRVTVNSNLIHGNNAGAGDGGGIAIANINGQDIARNLGTTAPWYLVNILNNMVTNNVSGVAGGGISVQDAIKVRIRNNTVSNNDTTSTGAAAFALGSPNLSTALPAGIVSRTHTPAFAQLMNVTAANGSVFLDPAILPGGVNSIWQRYSNPTLNSTVVTENRSFKWVNFDDPSTAVTETGLFPATCPVTVNPDGTVTVDVNIPACITGTELVANYTADLGVLDGVAVTADLLNPRFSLLTDATGYHGSNKTGDPAFSNPVHNVGRNETLLFPEATVLQTAGAFDEGGNFIQVSYGPLSLLEPGASGNPADNTTQFDYHLTVASAAINEAANVNANGQLGLDIDKDMRPNGGSNDIGADEAQ